MRSVFLNAVADVAGCMVCARFEVRRGSGLVLHGWHPPTESTAGSRAGVASAPTLPTKRSMVFRFRKAREGLRLAVPASVAVVRRLATPALPQAAKAKLLAFEAGQMAGVPATEVEWAHASLPQDGGQARVLLAAASRSLLETWTREAAVGRGVPDDVEPACLALYRSFRYTHPGIESGVVLLDVNRRGLRVLLIDQPGYAARQAVWPHAAVGTSAPWGPQNPPTAGALAERAHLELARLLASADTVGEGKRPVIQRLFICGEWSLLPGFAAALGGRLGLPVEGYDPLGRVLMAGPLPAADLRVAMGELVGLAARGLADAPDLPLVSPAVRHEQARPGRVRLIRLALAAAMLTPLPPLIAVNHRASRVESLCQEISSALTRVEQWEKAVALALTRLNRLQAERDLLYGLLNERVVWVRFLADLEERLAEVPGIECRHLKVEDESQGRGAALVRLGGRFDRSVAMGGEVPWDDRMRTLLARLSASPFVAKVEHERFLEVGAAQAEFELTLRLCVRPIQP